MSEKEIQNDRRKKAKNRLVLFLLIVILIVSGFSSIWYYTNTSKPASLTNDSKERAIDFSLVDLDGNEFSLSDFRGKIVIVDFMAIWCGSCKDQIPHFGVVWEQYQEEVVIMSIDVDPNETPGMLAEFVSEFPYATWIWAANASHVGIEYEIYSITTTIVIDQNGYISSRHTGVTKATALIEEIE